MTSVYFLLSKENSMVPQLRQIVPEYWGSAERAWGEKRTWCGLRRDADARHPLAVGNFSVFPVRVSKTGSRGGNIRFPAPFPFHSLDSSYSVPPLFSRPARRRQASLAKGRGTAGQSPVVEGFRPAESSLKTESPSQRLTPLPAPFSKGAFWCSAESLPQNKNAPVSTKRQRRKPLRYHSFCRGAKARPLKSCPVTGASGGAY